MRLEVGSWQAAAALRLLQSGSASWADRARAKAAFTSHHSEAIAKSVTLEVENHEALERVSYQHQGDS